MAPWKEMWWLNTYTVYEYVGGPKFEHFSSHFCPGPLWIMLKIYRALKNAIPQKTKMVRIRIELQKSKRSLLMKCLFYWGMTTNAVTTCTCTVPYYTVSSWAKYFCSPINCTVNKTFSVRSVGISASEIKRKCGHCAELVTFFDRRTAWTYSTAEIWAQGGLGGTHAESAVLHFYIVLTSTHTVHIYLNFSTLNGPNSWHSYGKFLCKN